MIKIIKDVDSKIEKYINYCRKTKVLANKTNKDYYFQRNKQILIHRFKVLDTFRKISKIYGLSDIRIQQICSQFLCYIEN